MTTDQNLRPDAPRPPEAGLRIDAAALLKRAEEYASVYGTSGFLWPAMPLVEIAGILRRLVAAEAEVERLGAELNAADEAQAALASRCEAWKELARLLQELIDCLRVASRPYIGPAGLTDRIGELRRQLGEDG